MATRTTVTSWDPFEDHVQNDIPDGAAFIDAKTTLIAAGPARLNHLKGKGAVGLTELDVAYPIGCMETFGINQTRTIQKIFEIGSSRSYVVPGRMLGATTMGRTLYNGRSLANVLYAGFNTSGGAPLSGFRTLAGNKSKALTIRSSPGHGNLYMNMASDLFAHSFGMLLYMIDNNGIPYGALYLEDNYLQGHNMGLNSNATTIVEGTSTQFDIALPVQLPTADTASGEAFL